MLLILSYNPYGGVVKFPIFCCITRQHSWNFQQRNELLCPFHDIFSPNQWKDTPETSSWNSKGWHTTTSNLCRMTGISPRLNPCFRPYHHHKSEVTYQDGLLFKDQKIIALSTLWLEMHKILHQGHLGIEKTKSQAIQSLFWPNMNADITDTILNCEAYQQYKNSQGAEPLKNHEIPDKPWTKVSTDLSKFRGEPTSLLWTITPSILKSANSSANSLSNTSPIVIKMMKAMFIRHGILNLIFSDNGPEFTALDFKKILSKLRFWTWH